jgi:hypothetical protein
MDTISKTIVRPGKVVNGEGGVLYILLWQVPRLVNLRQTVAGSGKGFK